MKAIKWSRYVIETSCDDYTVLYNSVTRGIYLIENNLLHQINDVITQKMMPTDELKKIISKLYKQEFFVKEESNEVNKFIDYRNTYYNKIFGTVLYILPTLKCNFICPYCIQNEYVNDSCVAMNDETILNLTNWINTFVNDHKDEIMMSQSLNKDANTLKLVFFGGEPTLYNDINFHIIDLLKNKLPDWINFSFTIITNGFNLDSDILLNYQNRGLTGLQITLDGPPDIHDLRRVLSSGQPTFYNILDTIKRSVDLSIEVAIRINVDENNVEKIIELIEILDENGLSGKLHLNIAPIDKNGVDSDYDGHQKYVLEKFYIIFKKALDSNYTISLWESFCGVYARSFFVVSPNGEIYKCPSLLDADHKIGSVYDKALNATYQKIINTPIEAQCLACKYVGLCGGGCYNQNIMNGKLVCQKTTFDNLIFAYCKSMGEYLRRKIK
jgi:uncharacterized protein